MAEATPTRPQLQALEDIARHGDPYARVHGMSQHGGWSRVMWVVEYREKWAKFSKRRRRWVLTDDGARALQRARAKAARTRDRM